MSPTLTPTADDLAAPTTDAGAEPTEAAEPSGILAELVVEEISIDGMCGVY
jgi:mycofactocin precursor